MTQVVFTETEAERLAEIRALNFGPSINELTGPSDGQLELFSRLASVRHYHRSELLTMLDAVAARARKAIDDCTAAVIDANKAHERAEGLVERLGKLQADLNLLRRENEALKAPRTVTYPAPGTVYVSDMGEPGAEAITEKPSFQIKRSDAHKYTVETQEGPAKNLHALLIDLAVIAVIANRTKA